MFPVEVVAVSEDVLRPAVATDLLVAAEVMLDECDGYVVLVVDAQTGEADAHGPYTGFAATLRADRLRRDFDEDGLGDLIVQVVRLHMPRATQAPPDATPAD